MENNLTIFDELKGQISNFLKPVHGIEVRNKAEHAAASGALVSVRSFQKQLDASRTAAVGPLNDRVKQINSYCRELAHPLVEAEARIKLRMVEFSDAENRRIAEEKRQEEDRARKEREKQETERRAQERAAREKEEAERRRLEEEEKARKAKLQAFGVDPAAKAEEDRRKKAREELEQRAADERAEAHARAERERAQSELEAKQRVRALEAERVKNVRTTWSFQITDATAVPREYLMVDEVKVGKAVRAGTREIAGVRIFSEQSVVAR